MPALGLTDHYGLTGSVEFYLACREAGLSPVIGLELPVQNPLGDGELVFYAMNFQGWGSLCRLSSILQNAGHRDYSRGISWDELSNLTAGLICLTGGLKSALLSLYQRGQSGLAKRYLAELSELFPQRLYVELQLHQDGDRGWVNAIAHLGQELDLPLVATHSIYYLKTEEEDFQRTLSAMRLNTRRDLVAKNSVAPPNASFVSQAHMVAEFSEYPQAIAATEEIAERCQLELPLGVPHYPDISLPSGLDPNQALRTRVEQGAKNLYGVLTAEIQERLDHELAIIGERGYAPLFLIVQEILEYARKTGVPVSSRGSAASSLAAHCLGITSPDPLALNLYFERFLNPARSSPPDIDTDLCSKRRDRVIQHVYQQYGAERVAMVATINRFRARSALREVAKAYGLSSPEIKKMSETLPWRGWSPTARRGDSAADIFEILKTRYREPKYAAVFDHASALLDYPRHLSVHPGGIVIAPGVMTNFAPTHLSSKGIIITQFDLKAVEQLGLVKIDLLGTRGLSVLGDVAETVYSWRRKEFSDSLSILDAVPDEDQATKEIVRAAQTIGCFQIESPGMRLTLREIDAYSQDDIMIALALFRPGPMTGGLKDAFVRRHLGQESVEHLHPALENLLADTYGVVLYQEQVLRIASELAGFSLADADLLRRAMSHFDPGDRMRSLKKRFVGGALAKSGVPIDRGEMIWDLMAAFAGYGFPKAHAASYAQIAWRSAWCKAHYPAEFMTAVLANWGGYYSQRIYLNEARRMGLALRPPHINHADRQFRVAYPQGQPVIYMGMEQVRNLTRRTQKRIIEGRPFQSLDEFLTRVDPRPVEAQNLIRVGALHGIGTIPDLIAKVEKGGWRYQQPALFDFNGESTFGEDWSLASRVAAQEEILGVGVDAHPLELLDTSLIEQLDAINSRQALDRVGEKVKLLGVRQTLQRFQGQNGIPLYSLELEDLEGVTKVFIPRELYRNSRAVINTREPIVAEGILQIEQKLGEIVLIAQRIGRI